MMNRTQMAMGALLFGSFLSGCGWVLELPSPPVDDGDASPRDGKKSGGASSGGSTSGSGGEPTGGLGNGGAMGGDSATGGTGSSVQCKDPCDCDEDGALSEECEGADCDDRDDRVFPGQTKFFAVRSDNPNVGFDFDCSMAIERPPSQAKIDCALIALGTCSSAQGFHKVVPACGNEGSWGGCEPEGLTCKAVVLDSMRMATCH